MEYEPNPKHKEPWQRGKKGSLCPRMSASLLCTLLAESIEVGQKRYACYEGKAYCGQEHRPGVWHGYPVDWREVPPHVRNAWIGAGKVTRKQTKT